MNLLDKILYKPTYKILYKPTYKILHKVTFEISTLKNRPTQF